MKTRTMKNKLICLMLCLCMLVPLTGCGNDRELSSQVFAMDTVMTLTAYGGNARDGLKAATDIINAMDKMLDPDSQDSYVSLLNNAHGEAVIVPPQVYEMLSTAQSVYSRSGGALDLSVYPLYEAWGEFSENTGRIPSDDEIKELLAKADFGGMKLTAFEGESGYSVELPAGTQISFGAVAKGYTANYAAESMKKAGVESAVISLGGNIQTVGKKPDGTSWTIAVEDPDNSGSYLGTLSISGDCAIVTSGSYQRFFIGSDGEKYHHLIDPDTGRPSRSELKSVTVVCPDGTLADCLSTAMFILGENRALQYWRSNPGFEMVLVTTDGRVVCTSGLIETFRLTNTVDYTVTMLE